MKKIFLAVLLTFAVLALGSAAQAAIIFGTGTPSPSLSPTFAKLVNFDDKPTGTPVGALDYLADGIASITELEGLGTFARYAGSQSLPNYVGTGFAGERGTDSNMGWDGTILIKFTNYVSSGGIGIADSAGGPETIALLDVNGNVLGSQQVPSGANVYVTFFDTQTKIAALKITGDFFAIDDLQWTPCREIVVPLPSTLLMLASGMVGLARFRKRRSAWQAS